jgi:COP9 signalosome complex subunit 3
MALDQFTSTVKTLTTQKSYAELGDFLNKQAPILSGNVGQLEALYESLDDNQHVMGCLAIVAARLKADNIENWDQLLQRTDTLFTEISDEHLRFSTGIIVEICRQLSSQLVKHNLAIRGIPVVQRAVAKLQSKPEQLTAPHADLTKLCLKAQCFGPILPILDIDITKVSKEDEHFDAQSLLLYYYYGGCIYLAVKQYEKALYFFEVTVTCPTAAVSHVMLEAYKKYLLLTLLVHGDKPKDCISLPKFTSPIVSKFMKPLCHAYTEIVTAYHLNNVEELRTVVNKYRGVYESESNLGLVNQVVKTQARSSIKRNIIEAHFYA